MNGFSVGDKVQVTNPMISGMEDKIGSIVSIDSYGDDFLPIRILFPDGKVLFFSSRELTLVPEFENAS